MIENYQKQLDNIILESNNSMQKLLLHSCCAPCSSYVIDYLANHFTITVLYYNPNLDSAKEYDKRAAEQRRLLKTMPAAQRVDFICLDYDPIHFQARIKGLEREKEGGKRCTECFKLRLEKTALLAKEQGFDYFATTLTISPIKNAKLINDIGNALADNHDIKWLPSDFKKKDGYKKSIDLSNKYNLYRQNYCGCVYSKNNI